MVETARISNSGVKGDAVERVPAGRMGTSGRRELRRTGPGGLPPSARRGFTLVELLAVITIVGILAAVVVPHIDQFKPNVMAAAERQLMDGLGRARQLAMSQRTTVYMVFVPTNFWNDAAYANLQNNLSLERPATGVEQGAQADEQADDRV